MDFSRSIQTIIYHLLTGIQVYTVNHLTTWAMFDSSSISTTAAPASRSHNGCTVLGISHQLELGAQAIAQQRQAKPRSHSREGACGLAIWESPF